MQQSLDAAVHRKIQGVMADLNSTTQDDNRLLTLKNNLNRVVNIPVKDIVFEENIRKDLDEDSESFKALVESVRKYGVLASAVVELREEVSGWQLICVAGHRRILAARAAGNTEKVPCLLKKLEVRAEKVGLALAENMNREDLHCFDIGRSYAELMECGWTDAELATHFGRDVRTIRHYLKMNSWPDEVQKLMRGHKKVFTTRVILREFAYRSLEGDALHAAAMQKIQPRVAATPSRKEATLSRAFAYFDERKVSPEVRELALDLLSHLGLMPRKKRAAKKSASSSRELS